MLLFGAQSRNCGEIVSTLETNRFPHRLFILFWQVSFRNEVTKRASRSPFHGSYGEPDSQMPRCLATTLPLRMHSERLINNIKRPRQTNIAFGFTGDTRVLVALLPYGKLLYRANTPPYSLDDSSVGMLQVSSEMIGSRRKIDKDQTPAILGCWLDVVGQLCRRYLSQRSPAFPSALSVWSFFARRLTRSSSFS